MQVCYEMTVEFNCNSMSTIIVYLYPSNLKSWPEKIVEFETVDDEY